MEEQGGTAVELTRDRAIGLPPLMGNDTAVAFVMNGIPWWYFLDFPGPLNGRSLPRIDPNDVLKDTLGPGRTIGGVVYSASEIVSAGVIECA